MKRTARETESIQTAQEFLLDAAVEAWNRGDKEEANRLRLLSQQATDPAAEPSRIIAVSTF